MRFVAAFLAGLFFALNLVATEIKIATYNTENLFDAKTQGTEYASFKGRKWSAAKYEKKLNSVATAIKAINADVIALQEIENEGVLKRLKEITGYEYSYFATTKKAPVGLGILSKLPLINTKKIVINGVKTRPIISAQIELNGQKINLITAHLPSFQNSKKWRKKAADELIRAAKKSGDMSVILGDFNSHYGKDFALNALKPTHKNLWSDFNGKKRSYKKGGTLDHILLSNDLFSGIKSGFFAKEPKVVYKKGSFRVEFAGGEASDHYALSVVLEER